MKKNFDSVGIMREIREKLSEKYVSNPCLEHQELRQAKDRFEKQLASKQMHVAEKRATYGNSK